MPLVRTGGRLCATALVLGPLWCFAVATPTLADTIWKGADPGNWNDASRWTNGLPNSDHKAIFGVLGQDTFLTTFTTVNTDVGTARVIELGYEVGSNSLLTIEEGGQLDCAYGATVGSRGRGEVHQTGGSFRPTTTSGSLLLGELNSEGVYRLEGGALIVMHLAIAGSGGQAVFTQVGGELQVGSKLSVGAVGVGVFDQQGGVVTCEELEIAWRTDSEGTYRLSGGTLNVTSGVTVGAGSGQFIMTGGTLETGGDLTLPDFTITGGGSYELDPLKALITDITTLGDRSEGTLTNAGEHTVNEKLVLGKGESGFPGRGDYELRGGTVKGSGTAEVGEPHGTGEIRGHGKVELEHVKVRCGRIVADGEQSEPKVLDFSAVKPTVDAIDSEPTDEGDSGWYAENKGKLLFPEVKPRADKVDYNIGEEEQDDALDLVHSFKLDFEGLRDIGPDARIKGSLLDPQRSETPKREDLRKPVAVFKIEAENFIFDNVDLTFRYDALLAESMGVQEKDLCLFHFDEAEDVWKEILIERDPAAKYLKGTSGDFSYFAIAQVPEPSGLLLLGTGVLVAVGIARRRHSWAGQAMRREGHTNR